MPRFQDDRLIMAVAQQPFSADLNQFCKLVPVMYLDGTQPNRDEFANDGQVWWMVTAQTASLTEPGHLVVGDLEEARRYDPDDPMSSRYQVIRESVRVVDFKVGLELLTVPGDAIDSIEGLVSADYRLPVSHRPTPNVMVCWRSQVYGPFKASYTAEGVGQARGAVSLLPHNADTTVYHLREDTFRAAAKQSLVRVSYGICPTTTRRSDVSKPLVIECDLLLAAGYEGFLARNPEKLLVESVEQKINRLARDVLTKKKRRELRVLLDELEVTGKDSQQSDDLIQAVSRVKQSLSRREAMLDTIASAFLESGLLGEDRIQRAEQAYGKRHVEERAAEIQAQIDEALSSKRALLRSAEAELETITSTVQQEGERLRAKLEEELKTQRVRAEESLLKERETLNVHRQELERQKEVLQRNLEQVTRDLREAGDEVVNRFLAIAPLIRLMEITPVPASTEKQKSESAERRLSTAFTLPPYVTRNRPSSTGPLSEGNRSGRG